MGKILCFFLASFGEVKEKKLGEVRWEIIEEEIEARESREEPRECFFLWSLDLLEESLSREGLLVWWGGERLETLLL